MRFFRNLNIGPKIYLSFSAVLLLVIILILFIQTMNSNTIGSYDNIQNEYVPLIAKTGEIHPQIKDVEKLINSYILTGDEKYYTSTVEKLAQINGNLQELNTQLTSSNELSSFSSNVQTLQTAINEMSSVLEDTKITYDSLNEQIANTNKIGPALSDEASSLSASITKSLRKETAALQNVDDESLRDQLKTLDTVINDLLTIQDTVVGLNDLRLSIYSAQSSKNTEDLTAAVSVLDDLTSTLNEYAKTYSDKGDIRKGDTYETLANYTTNYKNVIVLVLDQWENLNNNQMDLLTITDSVSTAISGLVSAGLESTGNLVAHETQGAKNYRTWSLIIGAFALVLTSIIGLSLGRSIRNPVKAIMGFSNQLAQGNLTQQHMTLDSNNELGQLTGSINTMYDSIKTLIVKIHHSSEDVTTTAKGLSQHAYETTKTTEEVARTVSQISEGAMEQAENTQTATDSVNDLGQVIKTNTESARKLEDSSEVIEKLSVEGVDSINDLSEKTEVSMEAIDEIINVIHETNDSAVKIGQASQLINSIADQTNLLALNAAIEAARAGEHGKGFAVVADEIRKLAEDSTTSTKEIDRMLSLLKESSNKAIETGIKVKEIVDSQVESVKDTESKYNEIRNGIQESLVQIHQILELSNKMEDSREEVMNVLENLAAIAEENAASTEETSASAEEMLASMFEVDKNSGHLNELAIDLKDLISTFTL